MKNKNLEKKIVLVIGAVLICLISFYAGKLTSAQAQQSSELQPLENSEPKIMKITLEPSTKGKYTGLVEGNPLIKIDEEPISLESEKSFEINPGSTLTAYNESLEFTSKLPKSKSECPSGQKVSDQASETKTQGKYVASSRGRKYHLSSSSSGKGIKESNRIYFDSKQEAESAGYEPGSSIK